MKRILVIEDNAVAANLYRTALASAGYDVSVATDGESGLAAAAQCQPDLVLLDLMLPKIAGLDVLRKIRATPELAKVPVMVTSNAYSGARLNELRDAGATRILTKAKISPKELTKVISDTIGV